MWRVKGRVGLQGWGAGAGLLGSPPSTSLLLSHAVPPQLSQRECGLGQSQPCWSLSLHIAHVLTRYLGVWVLYGATDGQHSACGAELCQPEHFRGATAGSQGRELMGSPRTGRGRSVEPVPCPDVSQGYNTWWHGTARASLCSPLGSRSFPLSAAISSSPCQ